MTRSEMQANDKYHWLTDHAHAHGMSWRNAENWAARHSSIDTEEFRQLYQHAMTCGLSPRRASDWAAEQLVPSARPPSPEPTLPLFPQLMAGIR